MADGNQPAPLNRQPHATKRGFFAGSLTLLAGMALSWGLAAFATRHRPERTEVSDALYWDFVGLEWCCGGNAVASLLAVFVGTAVAQRTRRSY